MSHKPRLLGSHISCCSKNNYLLGAVQETIDNGANCFMIFTGPPQNKKRKDINELFLDEAQKLAKSHNIFFSDCVVHAPYIINLATDNVDNADFSSTVLLNEITRSVSMGIKYIVLHPGFHETLPVGISNIAKNLEKVLNQTKNMDYFICLETMAGKRNQIGKTIEEINEIMNLLSNDPKIAVCLDTCHLHDAGYDLSNKDQFLKEFDSIIGISKIKVLHLGDSRNVRGSKKDIHANLGYGHMGFDLLINIAYDEYLSQIPIIVETPYWIEYENISDLHSNKKNKFKKVKNKEDITNIEKVNIKGNKKFIENTQAKPVIKKKLVSPYKHEIQLIKNKKFEKIPDKKYSPVFDITYA